ncbi:LysR family transcriptional regulator [Streptococcus sp. DD12]|uniref:LysR family transcriptional regulator n=1 Tax=Streptococcus sp. DD12 TaxID=1777880 RepID=UPI0007986C26|nr:LysR family transcriptional regulator [Streptococcus sp. DD12]KXT77018.1 Transcriptional regulator, LysR family [Streptococcus sp. DD12]
MDLVKCEAVIWAAQTGSFTRAAEKLGYTQSGITRMVSSLEDELGFAIFSRQKKGVQLTANGQMILPSLREVVVSTQKAQEIGADILGLARGNLTIGCYFSVSAAWMPEILQTFSRQYPEISVTMLEGGNREMADWLRDGQVDFCLCAKPAPQTPCEWERLYEDPLVVWLPKDHPQAQAASYAIKDLEKEAFLHTLPHQDTDQDRLIAQENLQLQTRLTTKDGFTTYQMVAAGLGVSFNQSLIAKDWTGAVVQRPLTPQRTVSLGLAIPLGRELSPASRRFIRTVRDYLAGLKAADSPKV